MRDTLCLRTRIAVLACVPGLAACSSPPQPEAMGKEGDARRVATPDGPVSRTIKSPPRPDQETPEPVADGPVVKVKEPVPTVPTGPTEAGPGPNPSTPNPLGVAAPPPGIHTEGAFGFPGDPPYIDGYNPEEDTCVSGNWCGSATAAAAVSVPSLPESMGCAARIAGGNASETIKADAKTYAGLSAAPNMQGTLNEHGTELARAKPGGGDMCCYHWFEYCSGRPHLGEHGPVLASVHAGMDGHGWRDEAMTRAHAASDDAVRQRVARAWIEDARAEHASVAAFARATLELMAVGAPASLLVDAQKAGLDEIEHARTCFGLAAAYGERALRPGPLPALAPRPASLPRLAADTFAEGCVGETIAALVARRAARHAVDPVVKAALGRIADDEARHAALAWSTVGWTLHEGGAAVAERLRAVAAALQPDRDRDHEALPPEDPQARTLLAHGRLDARAHALAGREAWAEIIAPMLAQLLDGNAPPA